MFTPGTIKPEEDYEKMVQLSQKLGIPVVMTHIAVCSKNANGEIVSEHIDRSRTYNRNYWNWYFKAFGLMQGLNNDLASDSTFGAGHLAYKNTAGTVRNANNPDLFAPGMIVPATAGTDTAGIAVGTGTSSEDFEGYALNTPVTHGSTSGKLIYNAMTMQQPSYNSGTKVWTAPMARVFNNNSGGTIIVTESAMYAREYFNNEPVMICRDLLPVPQSVLNAGQLTITYTLTSAFPA